ncbi:glycosyltransferase family 2 protein [Pelagerythrobacter sp.]|uniref:glycosyltransferase family 2 protein n=1 Tax=Pelagerythrobacter sp. TaxID=2800702 RepID=UPI0035B1B6E6
MPHQASAEHEEDGPLVSVIVPCFNHAKSVRRAVESALRSNYPHIEVVVLDDGSADDPGAALVELLPDPRVRLLRRDHAGSNRARSRAIEESSGEYITFLDADDTMEPGRLDAQLALARAHGPRILVFCSSRILHRGRLHSTKTPPVSPHATDVTDAFASMLFRPNSATLLIARSFYDELGGFDPIYRHLETHFQLRAMAAGARVLSAPDVLYHVHRDGRSLSTRSHGEDMARFISEVDTAGRTPDASPMLRKYCRMRQRVNALHLLSCGPEDRRIVLSAFHRTKPNVWARVGLFVLIAITPYLGQDRKLFFARWINSAVGLWTKWR